jgi:L-threonylcarbamoyladenylate synthase
MIQTTIAPITELKQAVVLLKKGEPIAFPTETVYGLGAPLFNEQALLKIFTIKNRPADNPLIVHVASVSQALSLCAEPPQEFEELARRFWPGPLTVVLKRAPHVPAIVSAGQPTIAIRMPSHPVAQELIRQVGEPIAAPSANLSGRPSPTSALDCFEDLQGRVSLILDGGNCSIGIESTVISLSEEQPILLRPGSISQRDIEKALQRAIGQAEKNGPILSPGMKYRHYAPKATIKLVFERSELQGPYILSPDPRGEERLLSMQTLYSSFREADRLGFTQIEIDCTPNLLQDAALMNRILKAASQADSPLSLEENVEPF